MTTSFRSGRARFLQLQRARERDVAVKMALVKFVEENRRHAAQLRILDQLAQQNSFGDEANARPRRRDVFEANLVADFVAEPAVALEATRAASRRVASRRGWRTTTCGSPSNP